MKQLLIALVLISAAAEARADEPLKADQPQWLVPSLHTLGVMGGMRLSLSLLWPDHFDPTRFEENFAQLNRSYSVPPDFRPDRHLLESDGDPWALNTIGHGLFGSEVYLRFRQCGHPQLASFAASAIASTAWEYGPEAFHKRPSAIDLLWTPVVGTLLGEGRFQLYRAVRGKDPAPTGAGRNVLLFVLDPFGEVERRVLGTGC